MAQYSDKTIKAKRAANKQEVAISAMETASRNAQTAKVTLSPSETRKATKVLRDRMQIDRSKTAARAVAIEKVQAKKRTASNIAAATGNVAKAKPTVTKKPAPKKK
jgi:hypothetical protein